jgi:HK97 family phage prohead protease
MPEGLERRPVASLAHPAPRRLAGYAAIYGSWSADLGGFVERVAPGAFDRSLAAAEHVTALWEHEGRHVLGRVGSGTLRLASDSIGLAFEVDLPDTSAARDLAVLVERRDVTGASFGFRTWTDGVQWDFAGGQVRRTLTAAELIEITVTAHPAYAETTVALRSLAKRRRWIERASEVIHALEARAGRYPQ